MARDVVAARPVAGPEQAATRTALNKLRTMLLEGELLPGAPLRQEVLASRLGVSRAPVREALRMLEAEGVVEHTHNSGYSVVKLTADELAQAYVMRRVLETELVRAIKDVSPADLRALRDINERMQAAFDAGEIPEGLQLNQDFHFLMFGLARLGIIEDYLRRVWMLSDPYRSIVIYDPETPARIGREHEEMVVLLEQRKLEELIAVLDVHRDVGAKRVLRTFAQLERFASQRPRAGER